MKHSLSIFLLVVAGLWNAVLPARPPTSSVYPLRPSANGRYMLDASNAPFLIIGDAPHSILANLSNSVTVTPSATALKARLITDGMSTVTIRLHRRWAADFTILPLQMRCTGA